MTKPKTLFLIDGLGAMLSAFLLGVVLVRFENFFGIPASTLYILAFIPILFAFYDAYQYLNISANSPTALKRIAIANLLYCSLSLAFAFYHADVLTIFGWAYIIVEILVVFLLAVYELKIAKRLVETKI